ncbi:MAG: GAF domain-containing protein [Synechococcus sp.]
MRDVALQRIVQNLDSTLRRDNLIGETATLLRGLLQVGRVVVFCFHCDGEGRVAYESVESDSYSIFGSTEPIDSLEDYAAICMDGRVRSVPEIAPTVINKHGRSRTQKPPARASLVAPINGEKRLWGLLIAQDFQSSKLWSAQDVEMMEQSVQVLSEEPSIHAA